MAFDFKQKGIDQLPNLSKAASKRLYERFRKDWHKEEHSKLKIVLPKKDGKQN